jgi:Fe-S-cluster-containing dehydrogenase component
VEACTEANESKYPNPQKPFPQMYPKRVKVADWSEKQDVTDRLTPYNWLFIQHAEVTIDGEETEINIPRRCMHCSNPPCVKLCPWGAARQEENGIARIDSDLCLGGSKCKAVCPWNIPQRQTGVGLYLDILPSLAGNGVMYKCDRCYNRLAEGELPACIEACPEDVQTIGPRREIIEKAHQLAKEINGYIYGEKENGGTNTIYVSPVPFEELNKAIEKGKGKPHLKPVEDMMAKGNNLVKAMALAPLAGVAAAVGKYYKMTQTG